MKDPDLGGAFAPGIREAKEVLPIGEESYPGLVSRPVVLGRLGGGRVTLGLGC